MSASYTKCVISECVAPAQFGYFADGALWCLEHHEKGSKFTHTLCKQIGCKVVGMYRDPNNVQKCMNHALSQETKSNPEKMRIEKERLRYEAKNR